MIVDSTRPIIPIHNLDPLLAGPLTDAGSTSYHAVNRVRDKLVAGTAVLVIGAGGLGSFAIQYLNLLTDAEIIVADVSEVALKRATRFGAAACLNSQTDSMGSELLKLTQGRGVHAVLDFVGSDQTIATGISALARRGSFVLIGAANGGFAAPLWPALARKGADIYSFQGPTVSDTRAVFELAEQGELENPVVWFDFDEASIGDAYQKLATGTLEGRAVIRIHDHN